MNECGKNKDLISYFECVEKINSYFSDFENEMDIIDEIKKVLKINPILQKNYGKKYWHILSRNMRNRIYYPSDNLLLKSSNKNVLLISHELSRTGAPVVLADTAELLMKNGYFVVFLSLKDGPLKDELLEKGIPVIISEEMENMQYKSPEEINLNETIMLDKLIGNFDFTMMCTATLYNFVTRYLNTNNEIYWWIHEGAESYKIIGNNMPKKLTKNIKVICGGEYAQKQLEINDFNYNSKVLNYGINDIKNNYDLNLVNFQMKNEIRFLLAGSVGVRKGQLILLEAIKKLPYEYMRRASFTFVGKPYDSDKNGKLIFEELKAAAKNYQNITVLEEITRTELYNIYLSNDVLVVPSIDDPMPVVATDNFMLNRICLCSDCTGSSYYIKDGYNGFVFENENSTQLSEKIKYIIDNVDKLSDWVQNSRKIYEEKFTMDIFEKNILKLFGGV